MLSLVLNQLNQNEYYLIDGIDISKSTFLTEETIGFKNYQFSSTKKLLHNYRMQGNILPILFAPFKTMRIQNNFVNHCVN